MEKKEEDISETFNNKILMQVMNKWNENSYTNNHHNNDDVCPMTS